MAEVLTDWPGKPFAPRGGKFYKYLDGQIWSIPLSDHPDVKSLMSISAAIRVAAERAKKKVRIRMLPNEGRLIAQSFIPEE